ncbi:peptidase C14 caspase catalytic subunit p20 [Tolypothrix sp. NIES-4075]|uniref:caspase family protein n=1 Tax=Tolypothrix sp. NIES-4075 TaxID=2005459 RepID=UPI000B5CF15D|nr:caspase family protein [Tolypothrix sp. NIES-4075]GAX41227.1 peptidase C14 caspase catalytic subunit p20 [Tolypothrix sp. NIES-4075]
MFSYKSLLTIGAIVLTLLAFYILFVPTNQAQSQILPSSQKLLAVASQKRVALVIGNSRYLPGMELNNPINDAEDMSKVLRELGFDVIKVVDADKKQMEIALEKFHYKLAQGSVGMFYYAGHGLQVDGENYLIPTDAKLITQKDVVYEALPVGKVQNIMEESKTDVNIIILDACRDNPFSRRWNRSTAARGLAPIETASGFYIAFATRPGAVASDGGSKNGTFTSYLLKYIKTPNITIENLFKKVRQGVFEETNKRQIPWDSSSLIGEFSFNPVSTATNTPPPTPIAKPTISPTLLVPNISLIQRIQSIQSIERMREASTISIPKISLTQQQQTQIKQIRANADKQIKQVLTDEQNIQIAAVRSFGVTDREAFAGVELTPQQRTQLQQILVRSQQQMEAVLTPTQRAVVKRERLTIQDIQTR